MNLNLHPYLPKGRFALAYSGGGDSTALLHAVRDKNPYVLIVDHALRSGSDVEAKTAFDFAKSLGLEADILTWRHGAITAGLQAKARSARYGLIGAACRALNIKDVVTGHTQDDQAETVLMRMDMQTGWRGAAGMARVSRSALWPQLAGVTLWRPILDYSRAQIRQYLNVHQIPFADDPSNENRSFTRIKARDRLRAKPSLRADMLQLSADMQAGVLYEKNVLKDIFETQVEVHPEGYIRLDGHIPSQLLKACLLCIGGQGGPIDSVKISRLSKKLRCETHFAATLAGCQITRDKTAAYIMRNPGAVSGRAGKAALGGATLLGNGVPTLWDGRWWITAHAPNVTVAPYIGQAASLPDSITGKIRLIPAKARPALPVIYQNNDPIGAGVCAAEGIVSVRSAVLSRLHDMLKNNQP